MKKKLIIILVAFLVGFSTSYADVELQEINQELKELDELASEIEELKYSRSVKISDAEVVLLARLIQSESLGEPYEGKLAVGTVVANRADKYNGRWWSNGKYNITSVIYRSGQFDGVGSDLWHRELDEDCLKAAQEVADGYRHFEKDIVFFHNPDTSTDGVHVKKVEVMYEIDKHVFGKKK